MGGNGGPDTSEWRAMLAGDDTKALERLARYKSPAEVGKALIEAQTKLSQRVEAPRITEESTPEQIAEYRKAYDVPEVPQDAKDEAYAAAYGLKLPEGVDLPEPLIGAFARQMNASHVPKSVVQKVVGEFAKIQLGLNQQIEKTAEVKGREWHNSLRDELGSREYEAQLSAANSLLDDMFRDNPDGKADLVLARLPGGGLLRDHPVFFKLLAEKAMGAGYTDRIVANSLESGGRTLAEQQSEIENLMFKDPARYNAPETQAKLASIVKSRMARGELDEHGNEARRRRA